MRGGVGHPLWRMVVGQEAARHPGVRLAFRKDELHGVRAGVAIEGEITTGICVIPLNTGVLDVDTSHPRGGSGHTSPRMAGVVPRLSICTAIVCRSGRTDGAVIPASFQCLVMRFSIPCGPIAPPNFVSESRVLAGHAGGGDIKRSQPFLLPLRIQC